MNYGIPLSGLRLQSLTMSVSANNVVNAQSVDASKRPERAPFEPSKVVPVSAAPNGVTGKVVSQVDPLAGNAQSGALLSSSLAGQVTSYADVLSTTHVSIEREMVDQKVASNAYKANAAVIRQFDEMDDALLSIMDRGNEE